MSLNIISSKTLRFKDGHESHSEILRWVEALEPSSRAQVHYAAGQRTVISGPFPTPRELIAGFWIIEVSSRKQAVEWASRVPLVDGLVELREAVFQIFPVTYDEGFERPG